LESGFCLVPLLSPVQADILLVKPLHLVLLFTPLAFVGQDLDGFQGLSFAYKCHVIGGSPRQTIWAGELQGFGGAVMDKSHTGSGYHARVGAVRGGSYLHGHVSAPAAE
jgi:hypothetical protein